MAAPERMFRYRVTWTPLTEVEFASARRGMKPDDGSSFWDWCDVEEFERVEEFSAWQAALTFAKRAKRRDVWLMPRIMKLVRVERRDDAGPFEGWDAIGMWEVDGRSGLDPNDPDVIYDDQLSEAS